MKHAAKVERYFEVFGRENVQVVLFDDLVKDTAAVYRRTLEFLGIDPEFKAELDPKKAGQISRMLGIRRFAPDLAELRSYMQFDHLKLHGASRPPIEPGTAEGLRELFAADIARPR